MVPSKDRLRRSAWSGSSVSSADQSLVIVADRLDGKIAAMLTH